MNEPPIIIHLPVWAAAAIGLLVLSLPFLWYRLAAGRRPRARRDSGVPDWSVPAIDRYADGSSFFHDWDPRIKIATLFVCCFIIVSLQSLAAALTALAVAAGGVHFCRIPWRRARRRLLAMAGFLSMFLIIIPFTSPTRSGETLVLIPLLPAFPFHLEGFFVALVIICKAAAVALLMEPMFGTAPLAVSLHALHRVGVPAVVCQMILLSHRYIFVFLQEVIRMYRGMRVRGFTPRTDGATMRTMGNFFGMLFIRSYERTQQVHEAMLCRGYRGIFPTYVRFAASGKDLAKGGLWITIGTLLIAFDHLAPMLLP